MRVGLLGGTFDPPHVAHLVVAEVARVGLALDRVLFLVAGRPWMKEDVGAVHHRVAMTGLAVADDPDFVLDERETRREGPTYTVDTVEELRREHPDAELVLILGADQLPRLGEWHRVERLRALVGLAVAPRPGHPPPTDGDAAGRGVQPLEAPVMDVSSSDLRARFRRGAAVRHQIPASVEAYIRRHGLYGADR